jgi:hypothetical protein
MRPVRHVTGTLALTLSLAVAAWLLPSSPARAGQGHGGGHVGWGGPGPSGHHGHHPHSGGYGGTWGGDYPYWGYGASYGGYYGYGNLDGNDPYLGVITPYWGAPAANTYTNYNFLNSIDLFR